MITLIQKYMKNSDLDFDAEIDRKLEECNDICKSNISRFNLKWMSVSQKKKIPHFPQKWLIQ